MLNLFFSLAGRPPVRLRRYDWTRPTYSSGDLGYNRRRACAARSLGWCVLRRCPGGRAGVRDVVGLVCVPPATPAAGGWALPMRRGPSDLPLAAVRPLGRHLAAPLALTCCGTELRHQRRGGQDCRLAEFE